MSNFYYEDALIAFDPSYHDLLSEDVALISDEREYIDYIDPIEKSLYTDQYKIQLCLDQENIQIKDSTFFRKVADLELLGYFELYNRDSGELLYKMDDEKWWIRDKMTFYGVSRRPFIQNKLTEIWLAQVSNEASSLIEEYERPIYSMDMLKNLSDFQDIWTSPIAIPDNFSTRFSEERSSYAVDSEEP